MRMTFAILSALLTACDAGDAGAPTVPPAPDGAETPAIPHVEPAPAAPQETPPQQDTRYRHPSLFLSFEPPGGWNPFIVEPPNIVRFRHPTSPEVNLTLTMQSVAMATALPEVARQFREHMATQIGSDTFLTDADLRVGDLLAHEFTIRNVSTHFYQVLVRRSVMEYYIFDCRAPINDADAVQPLFERAVRSLRPEPPQPSEEERGQMDSLAAILRGLSAGADLTFRQSFHVVAGGVRIGSYDLSCEEIPVQGRAGARYEIAMEISGESWTRRTHSAGEFTLDGRYQTARIEDSRDDHAREVQTAILFDGVLDGGRLHVRRDVGGGTEEGDLTVPDGTLLTGVSEILLRILSRRGTAGNTYASFVLYIAEDEPRIERFAVRAPDTGTFEDRDHSRRVQETFVAVVSTLERGPSADGAESVFSYFREDGSMIEKRSGRGGYQFIEVRR